MRLLLTWNFIDKKKMQEFASGRGVTLLSMFVARDDKSLFLAIIRLEAGGRFSVLHRSELQYTITTAIGHQKIARGWIESKPVGIVQELPCPSPSQKPSTQGREATSSA